MKPIVPLALLILCGCTTVRIESLSLLQGQNQALAFHSGDRERREGRKVSVSGLPEILARATWVDGHVFNKGGIWLQFADREVFLPTGFDFFLVRDVRGHFEIRKEDLERYDEIVQRIQKEANTAAPAQRP